MLSGIRNFIQMTETIGTSGQPTREQLNEIAAAHYKTVVNLALPTSDGAIAEEGAIVSGLGMRYVHIPVPFDNPTAEHLKTFLGVMRAVDDDKVWVHCVVNKRVSAFLYHYLTLQKGYSAGAAKNALLTAWEPEMDVAWKRFMALGAKDVG